MAQEVKVTANLKSLLDQLDKVSEHAKKIKVDLQTGTKAIDEELAKQTKHVETNLQKMASLARRVGNQLKTDFKGMLGVNAIQSGLALNNVFRGQISKVASLNDAVRKLGGSFGISAREFSSFQSKMMRGLGGLGLSAEDAAKTMEGLGGSGIKGADQVLGYSKMAGQLTSLGNEKGNEGSVAKAIVDVVRARGGNPQDLAQAEAVAKETTRAMETTGASASKILSAMSQSYSGAGKSGRGMLSLRGSAQSAIADQVTGSNVSGLLKTITELPPELRARADAMGLTKILGKNGELDVSGIRNLGKSLKSLGTSPELASKIIAGNEEFGDTIVRLVDSADILKERFDANAKASDDYSKKFKQNRGLREAFEANINNAISPLSGAFSKATQGMTDLLTSTANSELGSAAVVGGGALLSAALAAGGARSVMSSLVGSVKGSAVQAVDKDVQKVYVVNANEIGGKGAMDALAGGSMLANAKKMLPALAGVAAPLAIGAAAGYGLGKVGGAYIEKENEKFKANMTPQDKDNMADALKRIATAFEKGQGNAQTGRQDVNVTIQNKASMFDAKSAINRGKAQ